MSENKTGKYFKYALGEILLVVIGILIAIQLNEWRNEAINEKQKQNILTALKLQFSENLIKLDSTIFYNNKVIVANSKLDDYVKQDTIDYTDEEIKLVVAELSWAWTFNPVDGALRSAISSGDIHLIDNKRLVELLFNWEDLVEDSNEEAIRMRQFQFEALDILSEHIRVFDAYSLYYSFINPSNFTSDYKSLFEDWKFEDYRNASHFYAWEYIRELKTLEDYNTELINLIELEQKIR